MDKAAWCQRGLWLETQGRRLIGWLEHLQPLALLLARWHVGLVFFRSGLTKLEDWESTLALFEQEYAVPLLPPDIAAVAGTMGEMLLPLLLFVGLGGRFGAAGLSVVNVVAVLSLADMPEPAFQLHVFWGCLLLAVLLWGPGRWSVDGWWRQRRGG
jgi:putative oxidoreductase